MADLVLPNAVSLLAEAADAAQAFVAEARAGVAPRVTRDGKLDRAILDAEQHAAHRPARAAAYADTLTQTAAWAREPSGQGRLGDADARPADMGASAARLEPVIARLAPGATQAVKFRIVELLDAARGHASLEASGLDETHEQIRDQFQAFAAERVAPFAQSWHLKDELIPLEVVQELGALGVFGLTIPRS